jgi:hypothetical protein
MPKKSKHGKTVAREQRVVRNMPTTTVWQMASQHQPAQAFNARRDNVIYRIHQETNLGPVSTSSAGGEVIFTRAFTLTDLSQSSSLVAIFDQYKIEQIETWIVPTTSTSSNAAGIDGYTISSVIDYDDDSTSGATSLTMQQYQNCVMSSRFEGVYRRWAPHVQGSLLNSGNSLVGASNVSAQWIDCAQPTIKHYGMKLVQTATATTSVIGLRVRLTVAFRNVF